MKAPPSSSRGPRRATLAGFLGLLLAAGCGYSSGFQVAGEPRSIGVEIFGNESPERDLEIPLQDELTRALRNLSNAAVESPSRADVVVRGSIRTYHRRSGIRNEDNIQLETGVTIEVDAALYRRGSTVPERGPFRATESVGYLIGGAQDVIELRRNEREARERALRHIAEELVLDLLAPPE